jgi:hypothetical protein
MHKIGHGHKTTETIHAVGDHTIASIRNRGRLPFAFITNVHNGICNI